MRLRELFAHALKNKAIAGFERPPSEVFADQCVIEHDLSDGFAAKIVQLFPVH